VARQIIEVKEEKKATSNKPKKKSNIDFKKIGKVISENRDTIEAIAGVLLNSSSNKRKATTKANSTKRKSKKSTSSSKSSNVDVTDIIGNLLNKKK
jgi:hypothetical protein